MHIQRILQSLRLRNLYGFYLHIFPSVSYFLSGGKSTENFAKVQIFVFIIFTCFLLFFFVLSKYKITNFDFVVARRDLNLSFFLPIIFLTMAFTFAYVAFSYDLMFRRIGFRGLQENTASVPFFLLAVYRIAVETSFLVITFLLSCITSSTKTSKNRKLYLLSLWVHGPIFFTFYFVNSRLQLMLALCCLLITSVKGRKIFRSALSLAACSIAALTLVFSLTLVREFVFEDNNRVSNDSTFAALYDVLELISGRVNSVEVVNTMMDQGQPLVTYNSAGIEKIYDLYFSLFFDPEHYAVVKETLETSPSEAILVSIFRQSEVDFPKSIIIDTFLTFGLPGIFISMLYASAICLLCQRFTVWPDPTKISFIFALFILPPLLEFEKEFSYVFTLSKWSIVFFIIAWLRPTASNRNLLGRPRKTIPFSGERLTDLDYRTSGVGNGPMLHEVTTIGISQ